MKKQQCSEKITREFFSLADGLGQEKPKKGERMKIRRLIGVLLIATLVLSLAVSGVVMAQEQIRVLFLTCPDALNLRDMVPQFEKRFGIKVIWEDTAFADIHTKEMSDFISGRGRYDAIMMDNPWLPEFAGGGYVANLEPYVIESGLDISKNYEDRWPPGVEVFPTIYLEDEIVPVLNFYGNCDGKLYAIPYMPGTQLLYYRQDIFNDPKEKMEFESEYGYELAVPKTWSEFRDIAEFFTRPPEMYGCSWSAGKGNMAVQNYYNVGWSWGADCFAFGQGFPDPEDPIRNMPVCNSTIGVKSLEFFISLGEFMPPGVAAYEWAEITSDYIAGRVPMMIQWSAFTPQIEDASRSVAAGKTGYAVLPGKPDAPENSVPGIIPGQGYSSLGGWAMVMNKDSRHKSAAWSFLAWASGLTMTDQEFFDYIEGGFSNSGRAKAYTMSDTTGYKVGRYQIELEMYAEHLRRRPAIAEETEYEIIVGTEVSKAFIKDKTAKEALDDSAKALYDLMVRGGYIPSSQPLVWPSKYVNRDGTKVNQ